MFFSAPISHIALKISLAIVFFWFGIDKLVHPDYWINAWVPPYILPWLSIVSIEAKEFIAILAVFEILAGISFISGFFITIFASLALVFLAAVSVTFGFNEIIIRDVGLMGGLIALIFWPTRPNLGL